ncbi:MAG TPA: hypothetical protein VML58_07780 [Burkholderiaceae bacterium]|nr:hypothetical protein [Burkholderiaceae bacterium]
MTRCPAPTVTLVRTPIQELALIPMIEDKAVDDESFSRCGWFDSSLELAAGLQDRVHRPAA